MSLVVRGCCVLLPAVTPCHVALPRTRNLQNEPTAVTGATATHTGAGSCPRCASRDGAGAMAHVSGPPRALQGGTRTCPKMFDRGEKLQNEATASPKLLGERD
jgi:hypothetical protein